MLLEVLDYLEMAGYKIAIGKKNTTFEEAYDEWIHLLIESDFHPPYMNQEDWEFVRNILSSEQTMVDIFQEIISLKRQGLWFIYELLGFYDSYMDKGFD